MDPTESESENFNVIQVEFKEEKFWSDEELDAASDRSMPVSMDSDEEDAFLHEIDVVLDFEEDPSSTVTPRPPASPHPHGTSLTSVVYHPRPTTSTLPLSMDTPVTSAGGELGTRRSQRTRGISSLSPTKRKASSSPPGRFSHTSPRRRHRAGDSKHRTRPAQRKMRAAAPAPAALDDGWHDISKQDERPPPLPFRPRRTPGVQLDFQKAYSPSDIFQLFFSRDVIRTLCSNTNKYAARRIAQGMQRQWTDINAEEMLRFFSIIIYLGLVKSSARDMWRKDRLHNHPFPISVMPGYRFEAISVYLHMSDPVADAVNDQLRGQPGYDALFRLKPLQEQILTACRAYYHPYQNLAVDERMVATKAMIGMKQHMKDKPVKWGFKLFVLADSSNGYTCDFSVFDGKAKSPSGNGMSFDAVVNLLHVPYLGTGYTVYVDNFYTSSVLFHYLHRIGFGACGTVRQNRIGFPSTNINTLPKKAARGEMRWIRDGPLLFVKWKDTREVALCSTVHKAYSGQFVERRVRNSKGTWTTRQVPIPEPVKAYNKFMEGVHMSDTLLKYFSAAKSRRWYMKLFLHFLDIAVVNSFLIHKEMALAKKQKPLTQKRFRELLCMELADHAQPQASTSEEAASEATNEASCSTPPEDPEQKPEGCFPVPVCDISTYRYLKASQGRRKCVHCKMKTMFKCRSCNVSLCIVVDRLCFTEWHELKNKKS